MLASPPPRSASSSPLCVCQCGRWGLVICTNIHRHLLSEGFVLPSRRCSFRRRLALLLPDAFLDCRFLRRQLRQRFLAGSQPLGCLQLLELWKERCERKGVNGTVWTERCKRKIKRRIIAVSFSRVFFSSRRDVWPEVSRWVVFSCLSCEQERNARCERSPKPLSDQLPVRMCSCTCKKINRSHTHTYRQRTTPPTHTHAKNNTPNPQTNTPHKHWTTLEGDI